MKLRQTTTVLLAALCGMSMVAAAQTCPWGVGPGPMGRPGMGGPGPGPGPGMGQRLHARGQFLGGNWWNQPRVQEALELTEEQTKTLSEANLALRKEQIDIRAQIEKTRLELEQALQADQLDEQNALTLAQSLGQLTGRQVELATRQRILATKVLTPEQKEKAREILTDRARQQWQRDRQRDPAVRERLKAGQKPQDRAKELRERKMEKMREAAERR